MGRVPAMFYYDISRVGGRCTEHIAPTLHSAIRARFFSTALQYDRLFSISTQQAPGWISKTMYQVIVSDLNRTPIVQIITWFTLTTSLLAFLTHAAIKFYVFRSLTTESWFVLVSLASLTPFPGSSLPYANSGFPPGVLRCSVCRRVTPSSLWVWNTDGELE